MKSINEDIKRIKKLMNLIEGEQLSLDFEDDNTEDTNKENTISIDSPEFTKPFKEKVFFILKDIYGNTNWSDQEGRGTRGRVSQARYRSGIHARLGRNRVLEKGSARCASG
jgi:hypothetical protein